MESCCSLRVMSVSEVRWAGDVPSTLGGQVLTLQWEAVGTSDSESKDANEIGTGGTCTTFTRISCLAFLTKLLNKYK